MRKFDRREILKLMGAAGALPAIPGMLFSPVAAAQEYTGDLVLTLNVFGAWDVSSFCDPKLNTAGEPDINNWAKDISEIPLAGNIPYAPVWDNQTFFEKYYKDMLVINGIDSQTNSHTTGQVHSFSGRLSAGMPTITSSVAAAYGSNAALAYINNGGYAGNGGLVPVTVLAGPDMVPKLASYDEEFHAINSPYNNVIFPDSISTLMREAKLSRLERLLAQDNLLTRQKNALKQYQQATINLPELKKFNDYMPSELSSSSDDLGEHQCWPQAEIAMIAYKAGLTVGADLTQGDNFDTHSNHDSEHEPLMKRLVRAIDGIWNLAEKHNIADKVTLIVASDFSRTPYYNGDSGKDHWPLGSMLVMKKGVSWTNRVVGRTDAVQNGIALNPATMQLDDSNGSLIYPKDVIQSLRSHFGIANHSAIQQFNLRTTSNFDFFDSSLSTPQLYT